MTRILWTLPFLVCCIVVSCDDEGGDGDGDTDTDADGDGDADADADADHDGHADADGDGGHPCRALSEEECQNANGCMPIFGREVLEAHAGSSTPYCTGDPEFLECDQVMGCYEAETIACAPNDTVYWFPSGCIPHTFESCEAPGDVGGPCE